MTWPELCDNKAFRDLPGKIELNGRGQIIMSPTQNYHGRFAYQIARRLDELMHGGVVLVECAVETADGVKEADAAWMSAGLAAANEDAYACTPAPEVCVEVISPSNNEAEMMEKRALFIGAGAQEYWLCDKKGNMRFFDGIQELERSVLCPDFPKQLGRDS